MVPDYWRGVCVIIFWRSEMLRGVSSIDRWVKGDRRPWESASTAVGIAVTAVMSSGDDQRRFRSSSASNRPAKPPQPELVANVVRLWNPNHQSTHKKTNPLTKNKKHSQPLSVVLQNPMQRLLGVLQNPMQRLLVVPSNPRQARLVVLQNPMQRRLGVPGARMQRRLGVPSYPMQRRLVVPGSIGCP